MKRGRCLGLIHVVSLAAAVALSGCGADNADQPPEAAGIYALTQCTVPGPDGVPAVFGPPTHSGSVTLSEDGRYFLRLDLPGIPYEESGTFSVASEQSMPSITLRADTGGESTGFWENDSSSFWVALSLKGVGGQFTFSRQACCLGLVKR